MANKLIPLLTSIGMAFALTPVASASELTDVCIAQAVGPESEQSSLNIARVHPVHSEAGFHLLIANPASSSRMIETLVQEGESCSVVMIDAPGNGIDFANYLPPEYASTFSEKSQEFWKTQAPAN